MKFGLFYEHQIPRPADKEQWDPDAEHKLMKNALDQIELADQLGFDYVFEVEHHFLEEYSHSSAPEVFLAAASQRTKNIRLGHGIVLMPPRYNHPARVAERIATLDLVSDGRVEFGTGESGSEMEMGGFGVQREDKKQMWEEATREVVKMMTETPYGGVEGAYFGMPSRNVVPKPLQKPHPPLWVASSRRETTMVGARLGMGSLGFAFETPEEAEERAETYYELVREECYPIGKAHQPGARRRLRAVLLRLGRGGDREGAGGRAVLRLLAGLLLQPLHRRRAPPGQEEHLRRLRRTRPRTSAGARSATPSAASAASAAADPARSRRTR